MSILSPDEVSRAYSERIFDIAGTNHRKRKIVCPLPTHQHHNYTPSFSIFWTGNRWRWNCHGNCNKQGDVIDLVGYMQIPGYDPRNKQKLAEAISVLTGRGYEPSAPKPPKQADSRLAPDRWREFYPPSEATVEYAKARGISETVLKQFKIGTREWIDPRITWMTIPTFHDSRLVGIKMRNIGKGPRYRGVGGSRRGLFNYDGVKHRPGRVFVVKGEIAAMVMLSLGLNACAPTGGEGMRMTDNLIRALALADVIVVGDNDPDPDPHVKFREETRKLAKRRARELNGDVFFPPDQYKDIDDWIIEDPNAIEALKRL